MNLLPLSFTRTISKVVGLKYVIHLPDGYDPDSGKEWPMILFLHGAGTRGDDLKMISDDVPFVYAQNTKGYPFILVGPQCPADEMWSSDALNSLIDEVESLYHVDKSRIYLTGYSMGGSGTWNMAMDYPERFAAVAPLCGRAAPPKLVKIAHKPVWVFHGNKDDVVSFENSEVMVNCLKEMQADHVKFTVYEGAGHDVWTETYSRPELYEWFLNYRT